MTKLPQIIWVSSGLRSISNYLPPRNFITLHYAYFIGTCLFASVIFWGSSTHSKSVSYADSIFNVVSAMTLAGLNTVNLSELNVFQQFILFFLTMIGSTILVSIAIVHIRRKAFERRFKGLVEDRWRQRKERGDNKRKLSFSHSKDKKHLKPEIDGVVVRGSPIRSSNSHGENDGKDTNNPGDFPPIDRIALSVQESPLAPRAEADQNRNYQTDDDNDHEKISVEPEQSVSRRITFTAPVSNTRARSNTPIFFMQSVGARQHATNHPSQSSHSIYASALPQMTSKERTTPWDFLPHSSSIGRNSQFSKLTLADRDRLGGVEYRAITFLAIAVPVYFILWQLLASIGLGAYLAVNHANIAQANGLNPWWLGAFNAISAFNNNGMSLLDTNMVAFQSSKYMLITMGLLILAGNTCYPIFLRLIIWTCWKLTPDNKTFHEHKVTLRFLLEHPRRCYTTLFPSTHTWWLLATLIMLNGTDWVAFEILNIGNPLVKSLSPGNRIIDGLFQALAVRSGGFYIVPISQLRIGLLILYVVMMYISVYPVVITMRNSNVYEERSLGIYSDDEAPEKPSQSKSTRFNKLMGRMKPGGRLESRSYFVRQQLRRQLADDLWWIALAVLFITIVETGQFDRDPVTYSAFNIIFEVVSAYGCVGISVGLPNENYSFCGGWHVLSKLILCAVMIRGRHRGLPVAIDRAVLLPGEHLAAAEEEDAQIKERRSTGRISEV